MVSCIDISEFRAYKVVYTGLRFQTYSGSAFGNINAVMESGNDEHVLTRVDSLLGFDSPTAVVLGLPSSHEEPATEAQRESDADNGMENLQRDVSQVWQPVGKGGQG